MEDEFVLRVLRGEPGMQFWEEFVFPKSKGSNVIAALMEIQRYPYNREGKKIEPVAFEAGCLEEVCGSCSMLINGRPRQACTALIGTLLEETCTSVVTLAPLSKFPLVRDLIVDRGRMFENLKKVHAWMEVDSLQDSGFGPRISQAQQEVMYALSNCMTCGCCQEACPQVSDLSSFIGPAVIAQVRLFNTHPIGKFERGHRLRTLMEKGGIGDCGNAQNCVRVCPKKIPLTDAIAAVGRDVTLQALRDLFSLPEREA